MPLLNPKAWLETPRAWKEHFETARQKPSPFVVHLLYPACETDEETTEKCIFLKWTEHLTPLYEERQFPVRPIREIMFGEEDFTHIKFRPNYNGQ